MHFSPRCHVKPVNIKCIVHCVFIDSSIYVVICYCIAHTEAEEAVKALDGRWFGGRVIKCEIYDDDKFQNNDLSH